MLVTSYWLKTVLFWNGVQGKLQKGCLETTMHNACVRSMTNWQCHKNYTPWLEAPRWWGPRLQPIKLKGKSGTGSGAATVHSKQNVVDQGLLSPTKNKLLLIRRSRSLSFTYKGYGFLQTKCSRLRPVLCALCIGLVSRNHHTSHFEGLYTAIV